LAADPPLNLSVVAVPATEGQPLTGAAVATFTDPVAGDVPSDYKATIDWGDGSVTPNAPVSGPSNGTWTVAGSHTYAEEGSYILQVTVTDTPGSTGGAGETIVTVGDAGLSLPAGSPTVISGAGSSATGAMQSFEAAIGGVDNGAATGEQNGGYRHITWDDIALNGSDSGSATITPGHVISVAPTREQTRGIELSRGVAVANDGFTSVNPSVGGQFPAQSSPNVFAPFNNTRITMQVVAPAEQSTVTSSAATRGFGMMFLDVQRPTATIEYFSGSTLLYTATAPVGGAGQPSFVGVLFPSPAVTQVVIDMGSAAIFSFDGTTVTSGPSAGVANLVAADDLVLAEPASVTTTLQGIAGVPVSGVLSSFSDMDPNGTVGDYSAVTAWGDGSQSAASISSMSGLLSVTGTHTYTRQGTFQVTTTVTDFGGATQVNHVTVEIGPRSSTTSVSCSPSPVAVTNATTCTATVADVGGGVQVTPTGQVGFSSPTGGVSFSSDAGCFLHATQSPGQSQCSVTVTPGHFPPATARTVANYGGDQAHTASQGQGTVAVLPQACSVKLGAKRLGRHAKRLPVVVSCDMPAVVQITVLSKAKRGHRITFAHLRTNIAPQQSSTIRIPIYRAGLKELRTAPKGEKVSLEILMIATQSSPPVKIRFTVKGVKIS
jgi:hypothetical protein